MAVYPFLGVDFINFRNFFQALSGDCGFMAANLYARSIFGEDALANVSIECPLDQGTDALVTGHIRIRAKSQVSTITSNGAGCMVMYIDGSYRNFNGAVSSSPLTTT